MIKLRHSAPYSKPAVSLHPPRPLLHTCASLLNFPRTVPLDLQPPSFPHVLPIDEKCRGPLDTWIWTARVHLWFFFHLIQTTVLHDPQCVESVDTKLHHQIWLCYIPVETPSPSGSYDTLNEIQTPRSVWQGTVWSDPCLTPQRPWLPLFPHLLQLHRPSRNVLNVCALTASSPLKAAASVTHVSI